MKKIILSLVFAVLSINAFTQSFNFSNNHTALHVKNVDKSANFYLDILHLEEMDTPEGMPTTIRWFLLSDNSQIHLIQSKELVEIPKGIHMSFSTSTLDDFITSLENQKIHFENWFGDENTTNKRGDGVRQIYLQDRDGYWIEINDDVK